MEHEHTPGPWFAANGNQVHNIKTTFDKDGARTGNTPDMIAEIEYPYGNAAGQAANARLIAAAPDMLKEIQELKRALSLCVPWLGKLIADGGHKDCVQPEQCVKVLALSNKLLQGTKN